MTRSISNAAWAFALMIAPVWTKGGVTGLFVWAARRSPAWSPAAHVTAGALACVTLAALEMDRSGFPMGIAIEPASIPAGACDFMERAQVRGRGFNYFEQGGYLLWRFWPDRERLPFMTTAPELATPAMRLAYQRAMLFPADWRALDQRYGFDWVLLKRIHEPGDRYLEILDADSTFARVFTDTVSALYVRREGRLRGVAERFGPVSPVPAPAATP